MTKAEKLDSEHQEGQEQINKWLESLPQQAAECLAELKKKVTQMETFDLLSNISFYNHIHDTTEYTDYREDKMFVISELIALVALRNDYVGISTIGVEEGAELVKDIQELGLKYHGLLSFQQMRDNSSKNEHSLTGIAFKTMRDETAIRNPALPEHHFEFSKELYEPLDNNIKENFGFSVNESITLRLGIFDIINKKINDARNQLGQRSLQLAMEVFKYRSTKVVARDSTFSEEALIELNKLSRKQIQTNCYNYCWNSMFFNLGNIYCFTADELSIHINFDEVTTSSFLKEFSCTFPAVGINDKLVGPNSILKRKPLITFNNKYLLPSFPLLNWSVEPVIENYIKSVQKLQNRFKDDKHNFLLKKGVELFSHILKSRKNIYQNLFYYEDANKQSLCETDCIIAYERTLFIIEAKGHRISQTAKEGCRFRTMLTHRSVLC
jgi:hypothetical protein